jgi:acyl dehydratase
VRSPSRTITESDIALFAAITKDSSPVHTDAAYADEGVFGRRVGHGLLGLCLAEGLLSRARPKGAIALAWEWEFTEPFFVGDTLWAQAEPESAPDDRFGTVVSERIVVFKNDGVPIQKGRHRLALTHGDGSPDPLESAIHGGIEAFADLAVAQEGPVPRSSATPGSMETGVFFEDLALGARFETPAYTVGEFEAGAFLGLTAEAGEPFHATPVVAPLFGLGLVEGLKNALAPHGGVGTPLASLSWRWRQIAPIALNDTLSLEVEIQGKRASRSKTDRGIVAQTISLIAHGRGILQQGQHVQMLRRRPPAENP